MQVIDDTDGCPIGYELKDGQKLFLNQVFDYADDQIIFNGIYDSERYPRHFDFRFKYGGSGVIMSETAVMAFLKEKQNV